RFYDAVTLKVVTPLFWQCRTSRLRQQYARHVTSSHLDVGVGTGYFLDRVSWPSPRPSLTLVDLNERALDLATRRLPPPHPWPVRRNVGEGLGDLPGAPFESISMTYLLHCIPGDMADKGPAVFSALADVLAPGGTLFGSTILAAGSTSPRRTRALMRVFADN